ncbi:MAG: hypothetical protein ACYCXF_00745 [Thermoleophilia bacterium]
MTARRKKPDRTGPLRPRNPFAGKPQSGAGFHSDRKYGKQNRRREKEELDEEQQEQEGEEATEE